MGGRERGFHVACPSLPQRCAYSGVGKKYSGVPLCGILWVVAVEAGKD